MSVLDEIQDAMFELMNLVAPEHLEIAMDNAYDYLEKSGKCWFRLSWSLYQRTN